MLLPLRLLALLPLATILAATPPGSASADAPRDASVEARQLRLRTAWSLSVDDEALVGRPVDVARHPRGAWLVLDAQLHTVHVFDADGARLRTFGAEGGGPGEFRRAAGLFVDTDGSVVVVQPTPLRFVRFAPDGTILDDLPFDDGVEGFRVVTTARAHGRRLVFEEMESVFSRDGMANVLRLVAFDRDGATRRVLAEHEQVIRTAELVLREDATAPFLDAWALGPSGRVAHLLEYATHAVRVVGPDGEGIGTLRRDHVEPVRRDEEALARARERHAVRRGDRAPGRVRFVPSPVDRVLLDVFAREDGGFWLRRDPGTVDGIDDDVALVFDHVTVDEPAPDPGAGADLRSAGRVEVIGPAWLRDRRILLFDEHVVWLSHRDEPAAERHGILHVFRMEPTVE